MLWYRFLMVGWCVLYMSCTNWQLANAIAYNFSLNIPVQFTCVPGCLMLRC